MHRQIALIFAVILTLAPTFSQAVIPNDTEYNELWYLERIGAEAAWDVTTGSREVVIAILDAGVDVDHPDIAANMWRNPGEIPNNGIDDDGNGYVDDVYGWNFVENNADVNPDGGPEADPEAASHGSVIAGVIGAVGNNSEGVAGINWNVSLMAVRMLDGLGSGNSIDARNAIRYAVDNGADVINLSFSGTSNDPLLAQAIEYAYQNGVVVVAALGNENIDADAQPVYPACYGEGEAEDWVIGVGSTNQDDEKSSFSNYGSACVDISAPGEGIFGVAFYEPDAGYNDPYFGYWSGTSLAAPMVSGAAGLLLSAFPNLTPAEVSTALRLSVDPLILPPALRGKMGAGRLNLARAMEVAAVYAQSGEEEGAKVEEPVGDAIAAPMSSTVYFVTESGERRAFINQLTYFTHFDSFSSIENVSNEVLSSHVLSGLMLPKPGVVLVKIQSDPRVYMLAPNAVNPYSPILREITTEAIAVSMYGANWADYVIDIEPTFFSKFTAGVPVASPMSVDTSIMKTRQELAKLAQ